MWEFIVNGLKRIWNFIKKIAVAIFNFIRNVADWFRNRIAAVLQNHPNAIPIALKIKEELSAGNYNTVDLGLRQDKGYIVKTFYDEQTGEILSDNTEMVEYSQLDNQTKAHFADKDMLVLN